MIIGNAGIFRYQTTAQILAGPFVRATNHSSPLTGLTTAQFNCYYYVGTGMTSGAYTTALNGPWAEVTTGYYRLWLSTLMTGSVGQGLVAFQVTASGDPLALRYTVVPAAVWDSMIGGTGVDMLQVDCIQIGGASAYLSTAGIQRTVAAFAGSSAAAIGTGIVDGSLDAFYSVDKYWGTTGTAIASGSMASSLHAFNSIVLAVGASGTTVNSTTPWHQTSAQGFLISTAQLAGLSTLATANLNDLSTFDVAEVVTISTGQLAGLSTLATANLNDLSTFDVAEVVTISTAQLAGLSTMTSANLSTFGVDNVYDVWTHTNLMKLLQAHLLGQSSFTGSDLKLFDHAGTSFVSFNITTSEKNRTT